MDTVQVKLQAGQLHTTVLAKGCVVHISLDKSNYPKPFLPQCMHGVPNVKTKCIAMIYFLANIKVILLKNVDLQSKNRMDAGRHIV
jgi:hypothetical protein